MYEDLKKIKESGIVADFLFPGLPGPVKGKVISLTAERVIIESQVGGKTYQYLTHPYNICIVQEA